MKNMKRMKREHGLFMLFMFFMVKISFGPCYFNGSAGGGSRPSWASATRLTK